MAEDIHLQFSKMQQALHLKLMQITDFSANRLRLLDPTVYAFVLLTQRDEHNQNLLPHLFQCLS